MTESGVEKRESSYISTQIADETVFIGELLLSDSTGSSIDVIKVRDSQGRTRQIPRSEIGLRFQSSREIPFDAKIFGEKGYETLGPNLTDVLPIEGSYGSRVYKPEDLAKYVEFPVLSACQDLFVKNIPTIGSSANWKNVIFEGWHPFISIDAVNLDNANRKVGFEIGTFSIENTGEIILRLTFPATKSTSIKEIVDEAENVVSHFTHQNYRGNYSFSREELERIFKSYLQGFKRSGVSTEDQEDPNDDDYEKERPYWESLDELLDVYFKKEPDGTYSRTIV